MTGREMQRLRHRAGLTMRELGERLGVSGGAVCRWEAGLRLIPAAVATLLRAGLCVEEKDKISARRRAKATQT